MSWDDGTFYTEYNKTFVKNTEKYGAPHIFIDRESKPFSVTFTWGKKKNKEEMKTVDPDITELFKKGLPTIMEIREGELEDDETFNHSSSSSIADPLGNSSIPSPPPDNSPDDSGDEWEDSSSSRRKVSRRRTSSRRNGTIVLEDDEDYDEEEDWTDISPDYINDIFITKEESGLYVAKRYYKPLCSFASLERMLDELHRWMRDNKEDIPIWEDDGENYYLLEWEEED